MGSQAKELNELRDGERQAPISQERASGTCCRESSPTIAFGNMLAASLGLAPGSYEEIHDGEVATEPTSGGLHTQCREIEKDGSEVWPMQEAVIERAECAKSSPMTVLATECDATCFDAEDWPSTVLSFDLALGESAWDIEDEYRELGTALAVSPCYVDDVAKDDGVFSAGLLSFSEYSSPLEMKSNSAGNLLKLSLAGGA